MYRTLICAVIAVSLSGCMKSLDEQVKKSDSSIIGKKTQDIGEFDPNANKKVSDSKVNVTDPVFGATEAYGPMLEQISKLSIDQAIGFYYATNGCYPKDHEEFMREIIKPNTAESLSLDFEMDPGKDVRFS